MIPSKLFAHRITAALALLAIAGCNGGAVDPSATAAAQAAPAPTLALVTTRAAEPTLPARFVLSGEMTQGGWLNGTVPGGTRELTLDGVSVPFDVDGRFFAAFDRDAGPSALLAAKRVDGTTVSKALTIAPRAWKIEHINAARRPGGATEAFMRIRRPELERIAAARTLVTGSEGWRERFVWPVKGRISGFFGSQRVYRGEPGSYHSGVDITTGQSGTPFVAPADGVVILAADHPFTLEGNLLMIDHGMGLNSAFLHCSEILVKEGDHVRQGQVIGRIGMSGRATGPHLHWSLKWRDARLDPLLFTGPMN